MHKRLEDQGMWCLEVVFPTLEVFKVLSHGRSIKTPRRIIDKVDMGKYKT